MKHSKTVVTTTFLCCFIMAGITLTGDKKERLLEIAKEYKTYRQYREVQIIVTDSSTYKWTIALCGRPKDKDMGWHYKTDSSFISRANKIISPHGNKVYRLFVKDYGQYIRNAPIGQPEGQVIVKETWNVKEIVYDSLNKSTQQIQSKNDGKWYTPTTVSELFIMYKEKENPSNDKGWNYGIVSIEDKNAGPVILNNEKLSSCIGCHKGTKYDRIFGVESPSQ